MNTLVAVAIAPFGVGDELAEHVAEVVRVIRESGLPSKTSSMFTEIEGEWDEVMRVVKDATMVLAEKGIRTEVVLKADVRPGFENMMERKVAVVDALLEGDGASSHAESNVADALDCPNGERNRK
ncbi:MAG: MTH1187 family thiamine-binding protein [Eggerthellaceae bacterium]